MHILSGQPTAWRGGGGWKTTWASYTKNKYICITYRVTCFHLNLIASIYDDDRISWSFSKYRVTPLSPSHSSGPSPTYPLSEFDEPDFNKRFSPCFSWLEKNPLRVTTFAIRLPLFYNSITPSLEQTRKGWWLYAFSSTPTLTTPSRLPKYTNFRRNMTRQSGERFKMAVRRPAAGDLREI